MKTKMTFTEKAWALGAAVIAAVVIVGTSTYERELPVRDDMAVIDLLENVRR